MIHLDSTILRVIPEQLVTTKICLLPGTEFFLPFSPRSRYNPKHSLISSARVIENQICYDIKDANQIYELCYTRFSLHKRIYNHKTGSFLSTFHLCGLK